MTIMARKQGDGRPGHSDSVGTEAGEREDEVATPHSNGKGVSANEDVVKEEKLETKG